MAQYPDLIASLAEGSYGNGDGTMPGWYQLWGATSANRVYAVTADTDAPSGKKLRASIVTNNTRSFLAHDAISADPDRGTIEVLALVRSDYPPSGGSAIAHGFGFGGSGTQGAETSQNLGIGRNGSSAHVNRRNQYVSGTAGTLSGGTTINSVTGGATPQPYWLKISVSATGWSVAAYGQNDLDGTAVGSSSGSYNNPDGAFGLFNFAVSTYMDYLYVSVGTGGDPAPRPSGSTPISFAGSISNKSFIAGDAVDVDLAAGFSGSLTPFTFSNVGASLASIGLSVNSAGRLTGTAVAGSVNGAQVRGTDTGSSTADSNLFNITVNAAALPPHGTVTIGTVTVGHNTASAPFSYSASDQTGFEYRLNGGAAQSAGTTSPLSLSGLTASTPYTLEIRATNAQGAGTWSAVANFTTSAAPTVPQGTVTISGVTPTSSSASAAFSYSASDQTGYEYSLDGGAAQSAGTASPLAISGLTASTTYSLRVRAVNAQGAGAWSAAFEFTTTAASTEMVLDTTGDMVNASAVNSTITDPTGYSPIAHIKPRAATNTFSPTGKWRNLVGKFSGCAGKRPVIRLDRATQEEATAPRNANWRVYWTADFVTFNAFPAADVSSGAAGYYQVQYPSAFTDDVIWVMSNPMLPTSAVGQYFAGLVAESPYVNPSTSSVAYKSANPSAPENACCVQPSILYPTESGEPMSGQQVGQRAVWSVTMDWGGSEGPTTDGGPKRKCVLLQGQHAQGEQQSIISFIGAINWLANSPDAADVRRNWIFYVYACLNGSGIAAGHKRTGYESVNDYNREWLKASPLATISAAKAAIALDTGGSIDASFDWHGTAYSNNNYTVFYDQSAAAIEFNALAQGVFGESGDVSYNTVVSGYFPDYAADVLNAKVSATCEHPNRGNNSPSNLQSIGVNYLKTLKLADAAGMFYTASAAPAGVPAITGVDPTDTSAAVTFTYSVGDAWSYKYRLNGVTVAPVAGSPFTINGLTGGQGYTLEMCAVNGVGDGAWSEPVEFTTDVTVIGVPASSVPSSGLSGASCIFDDLAIHGVAPTDIVACEFLTVPPAGTFTGSIDGSFSFVGAPDGVHIATYQLHVNGSPVGGVATITIKIGV